MFSLGSAAFARSSGRSKGFRCRGSKTCKNTCKCCTGGTWRSKWPAPACSGAASALEGAVRACFSPAGALKMAALACPGATSALGKADRACLGAASATKMADLACSKRLSEPASLPPVRSKRLFERAVRDRCSQKRVSVALCSEPLHSALLCSVHGYARVHTSIYIYIICPVPPGSVILPSCLRCCIGFALVSFVSA